MVPDCRQNKAQVPEPDIPCPQDLVLSGLSALLSLSSAHTPCKSVFPDGFVPWCLCTCCALGPSSCFHWRMLAPSLNKVGDSSSHLDDSQSRRAPAKWPCLSLLRLICPSGCWRPRPHLPSTSAHAPPAPLPPAPRPPSPGQVGLLSL